MDTFGVVVVDKGKAIFGTVSADTRKILQEITAHEPQRKEGQSALRYARLRVEKRYEYLSKVARLCTEHFITDGVPNVKGLILGGLGEIKRELYQSELFDTRLKDIVLKEVDTCYSGKSGFDNVVDSCTLIFDLYEKIDKN